MSATRTLDNQALSEVSSTNDWNSLLVRYQQCREFSLQLAAPLSAEDCAVQSMPDASPTRWHLAHTTWFFETFVLRTLAGYRPFDESFEYLFNSYYNAVGNQFPRDRRGMLSRPGLNEVISYRRHVDEALITQLEKEVLSADHLATIQLGINHEQQHQELILTDIKHVLACNPLFPAYEPKCKEFSPGGASSTDVLPTTARFVGFGGGLAEVGFNGCGFAFDNESPRHSVYIYSFELANRCVTNAEYLEFIDDGGYDRAELWLSVGWQQVQSQGWRAPLYWFERNGEWHEFTMAGLSALQMRNPVCHVSYFEADAYARWAGQRLPTEFEWEVASICGGGNFFADQCISEGHVVHPRACPAAEPANSERTLTDMFGNSWEWTSSPYSPYPGFDVSPGALGEYNGKFMCNQFVLRGGSCATPVGHIRPSYRNFFPPEARWQFSGIRLANSAHASKSSITP